MANSSINLLFLDSLYKNWWEPPDEIIKITPSAERAEQGGDDSKFGKAETVSVFWLFTLAVIKFWP